jgi:sigma-B regulation protein RsbQ
MVVCVDVLTRNNVTLTGQTGGQPMVFAHGYGCDQNMWRFVVPAFESEYRTVLFDFVGAGGSDLSAYDPRRYGSLQGYAADVLDVVLALDARDMIGVLAAAGEPDRFAALVLVAPSPRYIDDEGYAGGFAETDIEDLLASLDRNYLGWSSTMAPVIMGNADRPELGAELTASFCRTDPEVAKRFARATFLSDNRADLAGVKLPTLVLQCSDDPIAPDSVGVYVHGQIPGSTLVKLRATGHCPNLSAPAETVTAIADFLNKVPRPGTQRSPHVP